MDHGRADKWLWAVRLFKSRADAAAACAAGKVRRLGHPVKAATPLRPGDQLEVPFAQGPGLRRIEVLSIIEQRTAPAPARACYHEQTEAAEVERQRAWHEARREAPRGRPTKRQRRDLDALRGFFE
jgi:ribosome-associated heat shock protein Hsp15